MKIREQVTYKGYPIVREDAKDYCTKIYHNTLKEAKAFIDRLRAKGELK